MRDKKAISDVIAEVFLISMAIAAVGIISSLILPYITKSANLSPAVSCIDLRGFPPITIKDACFNKNSGDAEVIFQRTAKELDISMLSFVIREGQNALSFKCDNLCSNCEIIKSGKVKTYFFNFPSFKEKASLSFSINGCEVGSTEISRVC
jgi:hypothetical protein